jgi:hypothetical protein
LFVRQIASKTKFCAKYTPLASHSQEAGIDMARKSKDKGNAKTKPPKKMSKKSS